MPELPADLITPKQAAHVLRCHVASVYRLVAAGRLRAWRRAGSRYLLSRADVLAQLRVVEAEGGERTEEAAEREGGAALDRLRRKGYGA